MDVEDVFVKTVYAVVVCLLALAAVAIVCAIRSNGEIDYCYVEMCSPTQMAPQYRLYAHRPWRDDRSMGVYPTVTEAKNAANELSCRLNSTTTAK